MRQDLPPSRDLVLVGGGHTHALVLRRWGMAPLPGTRLTLINPGPGAAYSGMLPGFVAGHYTRGDLDIDLVRLCRFAGARLVEAAACGIDPAARRVQVSGRPDIAYDVASIDVGITSAMPDLPGFDRHGVPAKPLGPFADRWSALMSGTGAIPVAVIGGGVAGVELALAMAHALARRQRAGRVTVIDRAAALSDLGPRAAARLRAALRDQGVEMLEHREIAEVTAEAVVLQDGHAVPARFVTGAAGARPHHWLAASPLADAAGFVPVDGRLRSHDPAVFAVGDCAQMTRTPRPKAGVYAVRQAPILLHNLQATLSGAGGLRTYTPQRDYLKLISMGAKDAVAEKAGLTLSGPWLWRRKDAIDRRFMARFRDLPRPLAPALPWPRAAGSASAPPARPDCAGCGAKIGLSALRSGLGGEAGLGDDAAILDHGDRTRVLSTDHLLGMVADPVTMARLSAIHALGDVWAMGARPETATATVVLPRSAPPLAARSLEEIMQAARAVFAEAGGAIVGGHSTFGAELSIGFTVLGATEGRPIGLGGARPGDSLLLTRPLGSGTILAAEMRGLAEGAWVSAALTTMTRPQGDAAALLGAARAMTDVTGFGLVGHLQRMCDASGTGAVLEMEALRFLPGAVALARLGVRSTLFDANREAHAHFPSAPEIDLLFDPQTCGGLLAALPVPTGPVLTALHAAGHDAAVIGRVTDQPGRIALV